jgi:hypothetical protein
MVDPEVLCKQEIMSHEKAAVGLKVKLKYLAE